MRGKSADLGASLGNLGMALCVNYWLGGAWAALGARSVRAIGQKREWGGRARRPMCQPTVENWAMANRSILRQLGMPA